MKNSHASFYVSVTLFVMLSIAGITSLSIAGGTAKSEDRAVSGFHKIDISGSFTVELSQGDKESLRLEADDDILPNIITEVKDGELRIDLKDKIWHNKSIRVFLTYKNLDKLSSSGAMVLRSKGTVKFENLSMELNGSANVDIQLEASKLECDMSGSSDAKVSGTVADVEVEISGAGNLEASDLVTNNFELEISGSGDAKVNVAKELNVEISGSGSVVYKGNPNIKKSISGSGSIRKAG
jgi:hypothetical protein